MSDAEQNLLAMYAELHDGLSEMIEGDRLTSSDIPDDYWWLVEKLVEINALDQQVKDENDD
jgi:hypothetical protein